MNPSSSTRPLVWLIPLALLLASFGRLVAQPSSLLVDADRPTVDRARVVEAAPGNDLTRLFWPLHRHLARSIARTGHLPEWDDRGFGGRPLIGNPQAGLFYPPVWLAWYIPAPATLGWLTVAHLIGASFGTIRLARTLGLGSTGQMVAGGCYALSPYLLAQTFEGHYPHVWAAAWYPWAFLATIQLGQGRWRSGLWLALCLAAVVLVGHPQEGYYLAIALGFWASVHLLQMARDPVARPRLKMTIAVWLAIGGLTLGLVAVEILPTLATQGWGLRSDRLPIRLASRYHPSLLNAVQLVHPFALGGPADYLGPENYWETVVSVGLVPLVLAGVGATWTGQRRRVVPWILLAVAALIFAGGRKLGLFALMYEWVPGMDRFRVPSRSLFLANLGVAVLAGHGVDALRREAPAQRDRWDRLGRRWLAALGLMAVAVGWGLARTNRLVVPVGETPVGSVAHLRQAAHAASDLDRLGQAFARLVVEPTWWLSVVGLSVGLAWASWRPARRPQVAVGLGLLGLVELAGLGHQLLVVSPPSAWLGSGPVAAAIRQAWPAVIGAPPPRIRADESVVADLIAVEFGWSKTDINDSFQIGHAADLYQQLYSLSRPRPDEEAAPMDGPVAVRVRQTQQAVFDRLSVAGAVSTATSPRLGALIREHHWPIVATGLGSGPNCRTGAATVARNPSVLPRAYVVPHALVVEVDDLRSVARLATIDPRRAVLMTRDPLASLGTTAARQSFRAAEWASTDPDRLVLRVRTTGPGLLVVADTWMPGWSAWVDGQVATVERGNHAQRVVALPTAGPHEVRMTYQAPGLRPGLAITLGASVAWVALAAWSYRRRRIT